MSWPTKEELEEMKAKQAATPPEPQPFPDEPRQPVGDVAFGTGEDAAPAPKKPMVPPKVAAGAPAVAKSATGVGIGVVAAQAAIAGVEMLGEAAKSPQGSIGAFIPGGGGGGQDYAGQAVQRAMLAALNSAGHISSRFGG